MAKTRIQKALAEAGIASRRAIEEMIGEGLVTVNGKLVVELPCFIDPKTDKVVVDGEPVKFAPKAATRRYFLLNKPAGVVCTSHDPEGRRRAIDCIPPMADRVYCVGRLDADSTGLILLTNDGDLTQHLTHPKFGVVKTYRVHIKGRLTAEQIASFKQGMWLDGRKTGGAMIRIIRKHATGSLVEIRLTEGRNREIRRILARLGQKVRRLHRSAIGTITDHGLGVGSCRELSAGEIRKLRAAGGFSSEKRPGPPPGRASRTVGQRSKDAAKPTEKKVVKKTGKKIVKRAGRKAAPKSGGRPKRTGRPGPGAKKSTRGQRPPTRRRS